MRSRTLSAITAFAAIVLATPAYAQKQVIVPPGGRAGGALSPAVRVGDLVFVSGQGGARGDSTIDAQTTSELAKIQGILAAAGTSMDNVVKCQVFMTNASEFQAMNGAYTKFFPADKGPPARTTVVVAALVGGANAKVEIECIAAMPKP